ncbi:sigma factor, partial [Clostridium paraputrificum]|uniref:sigma factor n=3 Tax=Clostridiaceae TaxID=31979 RepID=UPI00321B5ECA
MNDKEVVRCLKEREQKGIEILIDKYGKLIYGVIKYTINKKDSESDFEDIFYEVLMKIWDSIIEYDEEKSVLRNFIISITKYTAI